MLGYLLFEGESKTVSSDVKSSEAYRLTHPHSSTIVGIHIQKINTFFTSCPYAPCTVQIRVSAIKIAAFLNTSLDFTLQLSSSPGNESQLPLDRASQGHSDVIKKRPPSKRALEKLTVRSASKETPHLLWRGFISVF